MDCSYNFSKCEIFGFIIMGEAGKVVVLGAEPVEHPGSEAGPHKLEAASVQLREALWVGRHVPVHPVQEAELVGMTGKMGKKI